MKNNRKIKHLLYIKILRVSLLLQIVMFLWARYIDFTSTRYNYGGASSLGAIIPDYLFVFFGIINCLLVIIYIYWFARKIVLLDVLSLFFVIINVLLVIFYSPITHWAMKI